MQMNSSTTLSLPKGEEEEDRLRSIHEELSTNPPNDDGGAHCPPSSSWLPLESNPSMFTTFARRVGNLPAEWSFVDVYGFDGEALHSIPRPVVAVILLFPCTDAIYGARAKQKKRLMKEMADGSLSPAARNAFHIEQVASFGNACGSIAAVHSLTNADLTIMGGPLAKFRDATANLSTAKDRGDVLVSSDVLHGISDEAASDQRTAQTACPENGDTYLGHHYCCFVSARVSEDVHHLIELDGTKVSPVDHGLIASDSDLLKEAGRVIREDYMSLEPERIDFSLMALAKTG